MRVLLVSDRSFAGLRHRPQQMALGLAQRGHEVLYLEPPGSTAWPVSRKDSLPNFPNLRVLPLETPAATSDGESLRAAWAAWGESVADYLKGASDAETDSKVKDEPDVILCYHPAVLGHIRQVSEARIVLDCAEDVEAKCASRSAAEAYLNAMSEGLPHADGLIAINRYIIESWERYLPEGAPRVVIEHGVDLDLFKPVAPGDREVVRAELEISPEAKMITFLGNCDARISYEDLLTMMDIEKDTCFVFVGEVRPDGLTVFQRLPKARIRPLGPLLPDKAALTVNASDVLILPFRREPHLEAVRGLNLYEYLATGLPIVASFRRALKEYRELLYHYTTREELVEGLGRALAEPVDAEVRAARVDVAREAAWDGRVNELIGYLTELSGCPRQS